MHKDCSYFYHRNAYKSGNQYVRAWFIAEKVQRYLAVVLEIRIVRVIGIGKQVWGRKVYTGGGVSRNETVKTNISLHHEDQVFQWVSSAT